jgi:hypothetical protein
MKQETLPESFCWTRFGTEAGQTTDHILQRKERERAANGGVFIWGIGNALGPSIRELVARVPNPQILFSPIKSRPKPQDVEPPAVAAWTIGEMLDGGLYVLPEHSLVTSRYDPRSPKDGHYALVCFSDVPITSAPQEDKIVLESLMNIRTGRAIGASQVTAVVHRRPCEQVLCNNGVYDIAIRAELVPPYFIKLRQPLVLPTPATFQATKEEWTSYAFHLVHRQRKSASLEMRQTAIDFEPPARSITSV